MTPIYFPKTAGLIPRFVQQPSGNDTMSKALLAGLSGLTDVASNYREHQRTKQQGMAMADALEKEGLTQEANLYRTSVENASVNYFSDPATNKKMNQALLSDSLSLLKAKQERELKEKENEAMLELRKAQLDETKANNLARKESLTEAAFNRNVSNKTTAAKALDAQADDYEKAAADLVKRAESSELSDGQIAGLTQRINQYRSEAQALRTRSKAFLLESAGEKDVQVKSPEIEPMQPGELMTATKKREVLKKRSDEMVREIQDSLSAGERITYQNINPQNGSISIGIKGRNNKITEITRDQNGREIGRREVSGPEEPNAAPTANPVKDPAFDVDKLSDPFGL